MAQSQDGPVNVTFRALKRRGSVNPGDKIYMRISRTRPFRHLFVAYAESQDIPLALLSWSFDGIVVRGDQTPADLGLEVGGDVMLVAALRRASLRERPEQPCVVAGRELPEELLEKLLECLLVDEVHAAKRTSFCWRKMGRSAIAHGPLKPVNWVAVHGKRSMLRETVPASELTDCPKAWEVDPNETLRILFTWGSDPPLAARFLAIVEPSLDGLERIVRLCEPAHRFVYAKTQLYRWQYGPRYSWPQADGSVDETIEIIMWWAEYIGTPFNVPILDLLPVGRRDLVVGYVSRALQSWTDAAVAADFVSAFFRRAFFDDEDLWLQESDWGEGVPDLGVFTQGWDDSKASALVAAHAADVALYEMMRFWWPEDPGPPFTEALNRVDKLVQFKRRLLPRLGWWCGDLFEKSLRTRNPSVDRICQAEEEEYLSLVERASRFPGDFY